MSTQEQHPNAAGEASSTPVESRGRDETPVNGGQDSAVESWELPGKRYRIVGEIARGGMGVVLRAQDTSFQRPLAIKLLLPQLRTERGAEMRFLEEARITAQLQHPGIPPVHELGCLSDGRPYFSMKLIEGRTLADLLAQRPSPHADLPRFLKAFEQIAQTLAYAHAQGVIHRDLKPANVMVGAFGEVQVMDWGLARRLHVAAVPAAGAAMQTVADGDTLFKERPLGAKVEASVTEPRAPEQHVRTGFSTVVPVDSDRLTQAGDVMGTPAYMSPEQARGDIEALDERADVFGLGAILCVILTGAPPYRGHDRLEVAQQAQTADLADVMQRLEACGSDTVLIELCRDCLRADAGERPAHAGMVAARISAYLASVEELLEQARVERVAAEVQAREEGKRRRLAVGLAAAVVALILGGAAAVLVYFSDRARRDAETASRLAYLERQITSALDESERVRGDLAARLRDPSKASQLLSELDEWRTLVDSSQAAWKQADALAAGNRNILPASLQLRLENLRTQLQADEQDRLLAVKLDDIRFMSSTPINGQVELALAGPNLASALRAAGYDVEAGNPGELAKKTADSTIRLPLVAALDFWALVTPDPQLRARLLEVARRADPDPWRDRFRQKEGWGDLRHLQALAEDVDFKGQSPQLLAALAQRLRLLGGDAPGLLRRALVQHPRDFWLSFELGMASKNPVEQAGAFRTAVATRPESAIAYYSLGVVLGADQKIPEAVACYKKAIELDPKHAGAHNNLGLALDDLKKPDEAIACYRNAVAADPNSPTGHINLGAALHGQRKLDEAITCYRRALELEPTNSAALNNLGAAYRDQKKLDEAIACYRKALEINADHAMAWCNLGHALREQEKLGQALLAFRRGHELGSRQTGWPYPSAAWVQEAERSLEPTLAAVGHGRLPKADGREQLALAEVCETGKKRFLAAARLYAAALSAEPKLAEEPTVRPRYAAARAAVLAANGQGDAADLDPSQRQQWRKQASDWLTAELVALGSGSQGDSKAGAALAKTSQQWQTDPDLASVRDDSALAKLPADEQASWRKLWTDVAALRQRADKSKP